APATADRARGGLPVPRHTLGTCVRRRGGASPAPDLDPVGAEGRVGRHGNRLPGHVAGYAVAGRLFRAGRLPCPPARVAREAVAIVLRARNGIRIAVRIMARNAGEPAPALPEAAAQR